MIYPPNKKNLIGIKISKVLNELRPDAIWSIANDAITDSGELDVTNIIWHNDTLPISQEEFDLKIKNTDSSINIKELTPEEKLKKIGLTIDDLKTLLNSST